MIAAIQLQWLLIGGAAAAVVVLLAIVLLGHHAEDRRLAPAHSGASLSAAPPLAARGSFLDEPLARDFEGLGKPATVRQAASIPAVLDQPEPVDPFASHDDLFPDPPESAAPATAQLSDVMATTEHEEVDLRDHEVREMLAELMREEIELARLQQAAGQRSEAVLQLAEAEKIAASLGLEDAWAEIQGLLAGLQ